MDKEALDRLEIDYVNAINRFAGNEALYEKYLYRFKDDEHFGLAKNALIEQDYETVLKEIHTMKGVVGTLGMMRLFNICSEIVLAIRANDVSELDVMFDRLQLEYDHVTAIL